jgi:hypothetical protein
VRLLAGLLGIILAVACSQPSRRTARSSDCRPELRGVLPTYVGTFQLPAQCSARCGLGIDSVSADIDCGAETISYSGGFSGTQGLGMAPGDPRVEGREVLSGTQSYWGIPAGEDRLCIFLLTPAKAGDTVHQQLCLTGGDGTKGRRVLMEIAKSWKPTGALSAPDASIKNSCPYCG